MTTRQPVLGIESSRLVACDGSTAVDAAQDGPESVALGRHRMLLTRREPSP
jgi:hypothetical protein